MCSLSLRPVQGYCSNTLILPPRYTPDSNAMRTAAEQAGWQVERLDSWRAPAHLHGLHDLVLYGEPLFVEVIAATLSLALIEAPYDWLIHLPECYIKRAIHFTTLAQAKESVKPTFVKPVDGKCFVAAVYDTGADLPPLDLLPGSTPVLTAEPVSWEVEFRCFVLERQVVAFSPYLRDGELAQVEDASWFAPAEEIVAARAFITEFLADQAVAMPPAAVIDVGKIRDRGWAVVEANAAWGAGICGCDPAAILPVLSRATLKRDQLLAEDLPWVIEKQIEMMEN